MLLMKNPTLAAARAMQVSVFYSRLHRSVLLRVPIPAGDLLTVHYLEHQSVGLGHRLTSYRGEVMNGGVDVVVDYTLSRGDTLAVHGEHG